MDVGGKGRIGFEAVLCAKQYDKLYAISIMLFICLAFYAHDHCWSLFKVSRARARQGENERKSGMYTWYMSILSLFLTPYRRRAADFEQVLRNCSACRPFCSSCSLPDRQLRKARSSAWSPRWSSLPDRQLRNAGRYRASPGNRSLPDRQLRNW